MHLFELETPCLILDRNKLENNLKKMRKHIGLLETNLRPHVKTSKNIDVVNLSLEGLPKSITVSSLKEAEYFFSNGFKDILYAVGITPVKLNHVAALMQKGADIKIILDSVEQAEIAAAKGRDLNVTFCALIEIDSDGHRSGVKPDDSLLLEIGRVLHSEKETELGGVLTHAGESYNCDSIEKIKALSAQERNLAVKCAETLRESGLPCLVVSIGSTPTVTFAEDLSGVTEVRTGVYMFQDLVMAGLGVCNIDDIALSVLACVIGHQKDKGWIITDAGWMALSRDHGTDPQRSDYGYGIACDIHGNPHENMVVTGTNQEHGILIQTDGNAPMFENFPIGTYIRILPHHACATGAMHNSYFIVNGSTEIIDEWQRCNGW